MCNHGVKALDHISEISTVFQELRLIDIIIIFVTQGTLISFNAALPEGPAIIIMSAIDRYP